MVATVSSVCSTWCLAAGYLAKKLGTFQRSQIFRYWNGLFWYWNGFSVYGFVYNFFHTSYMQSSLLYEHFHDIQDQFYLKKWKICTLYVYEMGRYSAKSAIPSLWRCRGGWTRRGAWRPPHQTRRSHPRMPRQRFRWGQTQCFRWHPPLCWFKDLVEGAAHICITSRL